MLLPVLLLCMLLRSVPVSISMLPPGRVGLFLRAHASLKNPCRSKFLSNSSAMSTLMSLRMVRISLCMSLLIVEVE